MPWSIAKAAIDFALREEIRAKEQYGRQPHIRFGFFGGEPLLEWDLLRQCHEYASEQTDALAVTSSFTLTTNMTLVTPEIRDWLVSRKYYVGLSMDGHQAMHDTCRKYADGSGSHGDCLQTLELFGDFPHQAELVIVVDPHNVRYLSESVRWIADHSPLGMILNPNFEADWTSDALELLEREYRAVADLYLERYRNNTPFALSFIDGKIRTHINGGIQECDQCGFGEKEVAVSTTGYFYPCSRLVGEDNKEALRFGNVFDGYDYAKKLRFIEQRGNRTLKCADCSYRHRCMNWCGCINYVTSSGQFDQVGSFTCFHERLSIETADHAAQLLWEEQNPRFLEKFYRNCI